MYSKITAIFILLILIIILLHQLSGFIVCVRHPVPCELHVIFAQDLIKFANCLPLLEPIFVSLVRWIVSYLFQNFISQC
jgi:hypothetical protein